MSRFTDKPNPIELARAGATVYVARRSAANEALRKGGVDQAVIHRSLQQWLAIACLCGAELPELAEGIASYRTVQQVWGASPRSVDDAEARQLLAMDICPRQHWYRMLGKARDTALDKWAKDRTPANDAEARALQLICYALEFEPSGRWPIPPYRADHVAAAAQLAEAA